jgi:hypothetical protein
MGRWTCTHTHSLSKNPETTRPHFASGKGGHDVTGQVVWGGQYVTCDKLSTSKLGWTKNTWTDRIGVRMSQRRIVIADSSLSGRIVWVELSRGRFVVGQIV